MKSLFKANPSLININRQSIVSILLSSTMILLAFYPFLNPGKANAAVVQAFVRFDRMATTQDIAGTACLNTNTAGTETNVVILFPADWTVSGTAANWTTTTTNLPAGAAAWPGIVSPAASVVGNNVTFTATDLTINTLYCFNFSGGATSDVGPAGNNKTGQLKTQGGSPYVDTVDYATSVVAAAADQIVVTASVSATFTFSLSGASVALGTLSSSATASGSGITQTVTTNARNGWLSWVKSGTDGGAGVGGAGALESVTAGAANDIDSPGSFEGTPETLGTSGGYVLDVDTGFGGPTIGAEYNGASADAGGHLSFSVFRQTASHTRPAANDTATLIVRARAASTQQAASDYTDTLTVVAAGSF